MSLEAQDSPTIRTTCGVLILLFIVISVQANDCAHFGHVSEWQFQNWLIMIPPLLTKKKKVQPLSGMKHVTLKGADLLNTVRSSIFYQ